jgi:RNA polymerase sigma factor (sigma-70 family)
MSKTVSDGAPGLQQLTRVFEQSRKALAKLLARIVKPHDIEDIVQETYIRIYQASQKKRIYHAKSFMLQTARNLALNHIGRADALNYLSSEASELSELADFNQAVDSSETLLQAEEEFLLFCRALRGLSVECRRAFILRKVYGLSQREVARHLGITEGTVEKHVARGITTASDYLRSHGYSRCSRKKSRGSAATKGIASP